MILVPHADDELIGTFNLIKNIEKSNCILVFFSFTGYDDSLDNKIVREDEFVSFCEKMKVPYCILNESAEYYHLKEIVKEYCPNTVFIPSIIDWHWEHRKISNIIIPIIDSKVDLWMYQVTVPIPDKFDKYYLKMSKKELNEKYKIFNDCYVSQRDMPIKRLKWSERIEGGFVSKYAAEVYARIEYNQLKTIVAEGKIDDLDEMFSSINNLQEIRKRTNMYYEKIIGG
jgi:LmbE family N-acetylglucosaminyl deacetylase